MVDGAHNPAAADMMAASIEHYFKGKRIIYIMGVFADKDYRSVIQKTAHFADRILTIQTPDNIRRCLPENWRRLSVNIIPMYRQWIRLKMQWRRLFHLPGNRM